MLPEEERGHARFRHLTSAPNWRSYYLPFILAWRRNVGDITEAVTIPSIASSKA